MTLIININIINSKIYNKIINYNYNKKFFLKIILNLKFKKTSINFYNLYNNN